MTCPVHDVDYFGQTHIAGHVALSEHPDCECHFKWPWQKKKSLQTLTSEKKVIHAKKTAAKQVAKTAAKQKKEAGTALASKNKIKQAKEDLQVKQLRQTATKAMVDTYQNKVVARDKLQRTYDRIQAHINHLNNRLNHYKDLIATSKEKLAEKLHLLQAAQAAVDAHDAGGKAASEAQAYEDAKSDVDDAKTAHEQAKLNHKTVKAMHAKAEHTKRAFERLERQDADMETRIQNARTKIQEDMKLLQSLEQEQDPVLIHTDEEDEEDEEEEDRWVRNPDGWKDWYKKTTFKL